MIKNLPLLIVVLFLLITANVINVSAQDNGCADLFNSNCAECHELKRGCDLLGQSVPAWMELFDYMRSMDAEISEEDQATLLKCLSNPTKDIVAICK